MGTHSDLSHMDQALTLAASVQGLTAPNPWVGCVLVLADGTMVEGVTHPAGGPHAEAHALAKSGGRAEGATMYVTLEPCAHQGRTPPCVDAIIDAGVSRVVVAVEDPDAQVSGRGLERLRKAGLEVEIGCRSAEAAELLESYVHQRRTGRPYVVLKLAATLDGRTAAPDATSRWITGSEARADVHRLRARCDAILVGAGTVRADDPELTVRGIDSPLPDTRFEPLRVVLGHAPSEARVHPAVELGGDLEAVLDDLGARGVVQLLVEGGPTVAGAFHRSGLVDRYVIYLAAALFGGDDARPLFTGDGAPTIDAVWRGSIAAVERLGDDLRIDLLPRPTTAPIADDAHTTGDASSAPPSHLHEEIHT